MSLNIDILEKDLNSKIKGANSKLAEKFIENDRVEVLDINYNEDLKLIRLMIQTKHYVITWKNA